MFICQINRIVSNVVSPVTPSSQLHLACPRAADTLARYLQGTVQVIQVLVSMVQCLLRKQLTILKQTFFQANRQLWADPSAQPKPHSFRPDPDHGVRSFYRWWLPTDTWAHVINNSNSITSLAATWRVIESQQYQRIQSSSRLNICKLHPKSSTILPRKQTLFYLLFVLAMPNVIYIFLSPTQ